MLTRRDGAGPYADHGEGGRTKCQPGEDEWPNADRGKGKGLMQTGGRGKA